MNGINLIKAFYLAWKPARCDKCHHLLPEFSFVVFGWDGVYMCRKCYNKLWKGEPQEEDYYQHFNPVHSFIYAYRQNLEWLNSSEAKA